ncbi:hypothetical protein TRICI_002949 [Trichomonascus ciferrii]|uniref:Triacylglycerol lipase n=1 Tax=Trichomonascus ciferrii TaxID=44093 RepID=A0A642V4F1_9ASCO|nr:hypothetical protein TRICI_002949 [Trichomonascus ciferrii]
MKLHYCFLFFATLAVSRYIYPSEDDFYDEPHNLQDYRAGEVIRSREIDKNSSYHEDLESLDKRFQVLYRTTDSHGDPIASVTTLLIPTDARLDRLVSVQDHIDSASLNCSTSFKLDSGSSIASPVENMMKRGWPVALPDYFSVKAAFGANMLSGHAILDSIRALKSGNFSVARNATACLWGFDSASSATAFAAELQPSYAPELVLEGVVLGDLVVNITQSVIGWNGNVSSPLILPIILGLAKEFPVIQKKVIDQAKPESEYPIKGSERLCSDYLDEEFSSTDVLNGWKDGQQIFSDPEVSAVLNNLTCAQRRIRPPVILYACSKCNFNLHQMEQLDQAFHDYCNNGSSVEYVKVMDADFQIESAFRRSAVAESMKEEPFIWIEERFNNTSTKKQCTSTTTYLQSYNSPTATAASSTSNIAPTIAPKNALAIGAIALFIY